MSSARLTGVTVSVSDTVSFLGTADLEGINYLLKQGYFLDMHSFLLSDNSPSYSELLYFQDGTWLDFEGYSYSLDKSCYFLYSEKQILESRDKKLCLSQFGQTYAGNVKFHFREASISGGFVTLSGEKNKVQECYSYLCHKNIESSYSGSKNGWLKNKFKGLNSLPETGSGSTLTLKLPTKLS